MKKIIAGVAGLVMAMGAQAQTGLWDDGKPAQPVTFGVRAGMNVANVGGDEDVQVENRILRRLGCGFQYSQQPVDQFRSVLHTKRM